MNRHYLREHDFAPDAADTERDEHDSLPPPNPPDVFADEPEPTIDISPAMRRVVLWIGVPLVLAFVMSCWYGFYSFGKFLYDLAAS